MQEDEAPAAPTTLAGLRLAGGKATLDYDEAVAARMRRLRVGQGLRLVDDAGHESAARVAWISPLTGRFLVVNRRGIRKLVASPECWRHGPWPTVVRAVDATIRQAMKQVWQYLTGAPLRHPRPSPDPCTSA